MGYRYRLIFVPPNEMGSSESKPESSRGGMVGAHPTHHAMADKNLGFRLFPFLNPSLGVADTLAAKLTPKVSQYAVFPEKNRCLTRQTLAANHRRLNYLLSMSRSASAALTMAMPA